MKILVLDNYDSFTYNLVQYIKELTDHPVTVIRNDKISLEAIAGYDVIVLSPGPGIPKDAGIMPQLLQEYADKKPILGVCLGHQAIGECFGAKLENLSQVYHGVATSTEVVLDDPLWTSAPREFEIGRYHSWVIDKSTLPEVLKCLAKDQQGEIMAVKHRKYPVWGVQFHPESILTPLGKTILSNFLKEAEALLN